MIRAASSWYGKPANWYAKETDLERMIHQINNGMVPPRPSIEVREIAQWLYRKQVKRLESGEQQGRFSMMQAARGIRSGDARRKGKADRDRAIEVSGETNAVLAAQNGLSVRQIRRIRKA